MFQAHSPFQRRLGTGGWERLCEQVMELIGVKIAAVFADIDTEVSPGLFVFTLESYQDVSFRSGEMEA
jgi:uncharacterized protein YbcI